MELERVPAGVLSRARRARHSAQALLRLVAEDDFREARNAAAARRGADVREHPRRRLRRGRARDEHHRQRRRAPRPAPFAGSADALGGPRAAEQPPHGKRAAVVLREHGAPRAGALEQRPHGLPALPRRRVRAPTRGHVAQPPLRGAAGVLLYARAAAADPEHVEERPRRHVPCRNRPGHAPGSPVSRRRRPPRRARAHRRAPFHGKIGPLAQLPHRRTAARLLRQAARAVPAGLELEPAPGPDPRHPAAVGHAAARRPLAQRLWRRVVGAV
mmetsp:Transcript_23960/g.85551  ORF Transcript_23960/g.85551 Transcript_23960/m.85551 type:complete len:272 (-) Transcript_23960:1082-1897(-)